MILREEGAKLNEATRNQLTSKSLRADNYVPQNQAKGKNRFHRRTKSSISSATKTYNEINMQKLFVDNILDVTINVHGETDKYKVMISFKGFLDVLQKTIEDKGEFRLAAVQIALIRCFDTEDVYVHCSCDDWKYRFAYWSTVNGTNAIAGEQTSNGKKIRNPNDTKGSGCKHVLLVLKNRGWISKVASVITNYVNYMKEHQKQQYADLIYPAIYGKPYEDEVQLSLDDKKELDTDKDTLDKANQDAIDRTRFKKGNQSGVQFAKNDDSDKAQINFDDILGDEEDGQ